MYRGTPTDAPQTQYYASFVPTSLVGIRMTTMRAEEVCGGTRFQAGRPRPRWPTCKHDIKILYLTEVTKTTL